MSPFKRPRGSGCAICSPWMFRSSDFQLLQMSGKRAASTQHVGKVPPCRWSWTQQSCEPVFTGEELLDPALQAGPLALLPKSQPTAFPIKGGKIHSWASCQKSHSRSVSAPEIEPDLIILQPNPFLLHYLMQWRDFIQNPVGFNETLQNSTHIVTFPLAPLEIKDERCTFERTIHLPYKITAKGWHLGLDSILKNPFGSLVWASVVWKPGTVFYWTQPSILRLPEFFHFVSQMHSVWGHPEASAAAWRLKCQSFSVFSFTQ